TGREIWVLMPFTGVHPCLTVGSRQPGQGTLGGPPDVSYRASRGNGPVRDGGPATDGDGSLPRGGWLERRGRGRPGSAPDVLDRMRGLYPAHRGHGQVLRRRGGPPDSRSRNQRLPRLPRRASALSQQRLLPTGQTPSQCASGGLVISRGKSDA